MDRNRFEQIIAAYGAEPRSWPESERAAALALAAAEPAWSEAALARERSLDRVLATDGQKLPAPEMLARRILRAAPKPTFGRSALAALAACTVMGVFLGYGGGSSIAVASPNEDLLELAFEEPYLGELGDGDE